MTTIKLTTIGARTGKERRVSLYAVIDGDAVAIVGSWGGRHKHPSWVHNLRANPRATVQRGKTTSEVVARETRGTERERLWKLLVEGFPMYERYQQRTDRRFAIFRLDPAK